MKAKSVKKCVAILFLLYLLALIYVLFLNNPRRGGLFLMEIKPFSKEHFEMFLNLVPFRTEIDYFKQLSEHSINTGIVVMNIGVNLILFLPMGMALPVLFDNKINKLWKVIIIVAVIVIICEVIQFLTLRGSADVDDVILNTAGAVLGYGLLKISYIRKILKLDRCD